MFKLMGWFTGLAVVGAVFAGNAAAHGAYAEGVKGGTIVPWGFSGGYSVKAQSQFEAMYFSLKECVEGKGFSPEVRAECKVVVVFRGQCLAVSFQGRGTGYAWAVENDQPAAERAARKKCEAKKSPNGGECAVAVSVCDGEQTVAGLQPANSMLNAPNGSASQSGAVGAAPH